MVRRIFAVALAVIGAGAVTGASEPAASAAAAASPPAWTWVLVPGGFARSDCVHSIPIGGSVAPNAGGGQDVTLNGSLIAHYDDCPVKVNTPGTAASAGNDGIVPAAAGGWVEGAQRVESPFSGWNDDYITSTWHVPPNPAQNGGTIFFFDGLEPFGYGAIIQPVLQWGPSAIGGGNFWGIAPWYVFGGSVYHGPLERVSAGDEIYGYVYSTSENGNNINWYNEIIDATSGVYSYFNGSSYGYQWTNSYIGVLEMYNISNCSQVPPPFYYEVSDSWLYHSPAYTYDSDGSGYSGTTYAYSSWSPSYQGPNCGWYQLYIGSNDWLFGI